MTKLDSTTGPDVVPLPEHIRCVRCKVRRRLSSMTGCLCGDCEDAIHGMTQAQLDADWEAHCG